MTCHQQQQLSGCLLDTEAWVSSHSKLLMYAHIFQSKPEMWEKSEVSVGLDFFSLNEQLFNILRHRMTCCTSPHVQPSLLTHILIFVSTCFDGG